MAQEVEYILRARQPIRAYVLSGALIVAGGLFGTEAIINQWSIIWSAVFAALLVLGLAMLIAAIASTKKNVVRICLDARGYVIDKKRRGDWESVTRITQSNDGVVLTIFHEENFKTVLLCPLGHNDPELDRMVKDISVRLARWRSSH